MFENIRRIREILKSLETSSGVTVGGWVRTKRSSKSFTFLELNDGSSLANLQVIVDESIENYASNVESLTTGSSVVVEGDLVESPGAGQKFELRATRVKLFNTAEADYPLQKKRHSFEFLRGISHLRPRTNALGAVTRLRNSLSFAVHTFFQQRGFMWVHTPIITSSDCEGAGEMFSVSTMDFADIPKTEDGSVDYSKDFFGKRAGLTVSGQLEAEIYATAMSRVYTFGPTFRAENSNTARHLAEFWMIEPEAAFFTLEEDMALAEEFVRFLVGWSLEKDADDLELFNLRIEKTLLETLRHVAESSFERLSYTDAVDILRKSGKEFEYPLEWGTDLQTEHERYLTEVVFKKPIIVYNYPKEIKAFYMKLNDDGKTVRAMDVLVPRIGELIGGSEREDRHDVLLSRIRELGLSETDYWWYLDLRKYGSVPHAGFGLGFERLLLFMTGMQNIREVIPFPRWPGNAEF